MDFFINLLRGVLGMVVLIGVGYIFSANRKGINWRTVGLGLLAQLLLALGVLKVPFIKNIFEFIGGIFVQILEFTKAGSTFLLGGMMDAKSYGFIFLFQVLPTIIFFSALTSLLFYLGVIQKVVKWFAIVFTKLLHISGAESLSVTGNIFLGQTASHFKEIELTQPGHDRTDQRQMQVIFLAYQHVWQKVFLLPRKSDQIVTIDQSFNGSMASGMFHHWCFYFI